MSRVNWATIGFFAVGALLRRILHNFPGNSSSDALEDSSISFREKEFLFLVGACQEPIFPANIEKVSSGWLLKRLWPLEGWGIGAYAFVHVKRGLTTNHC